MERGAFFDTRVQNSTMQAVPDGLQLGAALAADDDADGIDKRTGGDCQHKAHQVADRQQGAAVCRCAAQQGGQQDVQNACRCKAEQEAAAHPHTGDDKV